jgi:hypothetical protein
MVAGWATFLTPKVISLVLKESQNPKMVHLADKVVFYASIQPRSCLREERKATFYRNYNFPGIMQDIEKTKMKSFFLKP